MSTRRIFICALVIVTGLALRGLGPHFGIPMGLVKYGGSALWGAMVFFLVAIAAPEAGRPALAAGAILIAIAVEFSRLYHTPWLDAFRLTLAGALLLGRIFSLWNIGAYALGIAVAMLIDARQARIAKAAAAGR